MAVNLHRLIAAKFLDHGISIIAINLGSRILASLLTLTKILEPRNLARLMGMFLACEVPGYRL